MATYERLIADNSDLKMRWYDKIEIYEYDDLTRPRLVERGTSTRVTDTIYFYLNSYLTSMTTISFI